MAPPPDKRLPALQRALSKKPPPSVVAEPFLFDLTQFDMHALKSSRVRLEGLDRHLNLPLLAPQAEQLASVARKASHAGGAAAEAEESESGCLELDREVFRGLIEGSHYDDFWFRYEIDDLASDAVEKITPGLKVRECGDWGRPLRKVFLCKPGHRFEPQLRAEPLVANAFATLTVQFPSASSGSTALKNVSRRSFLAMNTEVSDARIVDWEYWRNYHRDHGDIEQTKYNQAAYDEFQAEVRKWKEYSNRHGYFAHYSCSFNEPDRKPVDLPFSDDYRLVLVYDIRWCGSDMAMPRPDGVRLRSVLRALTSEASPSDRSRWMSHFYLSNLYARESLAQSGLLALTGDDRRHLETAEAAWKGRCTPKVADDLTVVIVEVDFAAASRSSACLKFAYNASGSPLDVRRYSFLGESHLKYSISDLSDCGIAVSSESCALAVHVWPCEKEAALRLDAHGFLKPRFASSLKDKTEAARVEGVVEDVVMWIELKAPSVPTWANVIFLWKFCTRHGFGFLAERCMRVSSTLECATDGAGDAVLDTVRKFSWSKMASGVEAFLCTSNPRASYSVAERLKVISALHQEMPMGMLRKSLRTVVEAITMLKNDNARVDCSWPCFVHVLAQIDISPDDSFIGALIAMVGLFDHHDEGILEKLADEASSKIDGARYQSRCVLSALFMAANESLYNARLSLCDQYLLDESSESFIRFPWEGFLKNVVTLLRNHATSAAVEASFSALSSRISEPSVVARHGARVNDVLIRAAFEVLDTVELSQSAGSPLSTELTMLAKFTIPVLTWDVLKKKANLSEEPAEVQASFPGVSSGFEKVDEFFADYNKSTFLFYDGRYSFPNCRRIVQDLKSRGCLPDGTFCEARDFCSALYTHVFFQKPCHAKIDRQANYLQSKAMLEKYSERLSSLTAMTVPQAAWPVIVPNTGEPVSKRQKQDPPGSRMASTAMSAYATTTVASTLPSSADTTSFACQDDGPIGFPGS